MLGEKPTGKKCSGMEGLVKEGAELMEEDYGEEVLDVALISAAQRVKHCRDCRIRHCVCVCGSPGRIGTVFAASPESRGRERSRSQIDRAVRRGSNREANSTKPVESEQSGKRKPQRVA